MTERTVADKAYAAGHYWGKNGGPHACPYASKEAASAWERGYLVAVAEKQSNLNRERYHISKYLPYLLREPRTISELLDMLRGLGLHANRKSFYWLVHKKIARGVVKVAGHQKRRGAVPEWMYQWNGRPATDKELTQYELDLLNEAESRCRP